MNLSALPFSELARRLNETGVAVRTGPFVFRVRSPILAVAKGLHRMYAGYPLALDDEFVDFDVHMDRGAGLRRWVGAQVRFRYDGASPFEPLPISHAYPLLEWSMNWCISTQAHQYLMLHAAVIEREGLAAILPAPPGHGKSTLCAALTSRGWRLLSDELTLISPSSGAIVPLCRPISLKNESLALIRDYAPGAVFSDVVHDTSKGAVGHMGVDRSFLDCIDTHARPAWIVFPRYIAGSASRLSPRSRASSMLGLARNAFNYAILGRTGFETLADIVDQTECHDFVYSGLDDAVRTFDTLSASSR